VYVSRLRYWYWKHLIQFHKNDKSSTFRVWSNQSQLITDHRQIEFYYDTCYYYSSQLIEILEYMKYVFLSMIYLCLNLNRSSNERSRPEKIPAKLIRFFRSEHTHTQLLAYVSRKVIKVVVPVPATAAVANEVEDPREVPYESYLP